MHRVFCPTGVLRACSASSAAPGLALLSSAGARLQTYEGGYKLASVASDGTATDRGWMNSWTIFYWGWWIAWAPFVGMFIAKISRGRTVRNIINGAMTGPVLYGCVPRLPAGCSACL